MKLLELDRYFKDIMNIEDLEDKDPSLNGIQVSARNENNAEIKKIAFAVDACLETFRRAFEQGADMVFVHHGLFWGKPLRIAGGHFDRVKFLLENNIALYAAHLPLDMNSEFGNNAGLCSAIGLRNLRPFGLFKGIKMGFCGEFEEVVTIKQVLEMLSLNEAQCLSILPFGPELIKTAAVISGGAAYEVAEAIEERVDLYITGEISHSVYHSCMENRINMISGGHYNTETLGVKMLAKKVSKELGIETCFIDNPTGL